MQQAYLSGLGMMGRRHLKGLVRAGMKVVAFDPNPASHIKGAEDLSAAGLSGNHVCFVTEPADGRFDVAVFSETAAYRHANVAKFLARAKAERYLLEKPLSADPAQVENFAALFAEAGALPGSVFVNFPRRLWGITLRLRELIGSAKEVQMTINGGAFGLGCNGIHYLDTFLHFSGTSDAEVLFSELDAMPVASGRGSQFYDHGGRFLVRSGNSLLFCSSSANSSAPVVVSVRGDHFIASIDEADLSWKLLLRAEASTLPNYRYGGDYSIVEECRLDVPPLDIVTERWARGSALLPTLADALSAHRLLHNILIAGGAKPPFQYT